MAYIKVLKNKAYFKNYQTKKRRRREGKTDYLARSGLVRQAKDKYGAVKRRLVVRRTCSRIVCQVVYATLAGDRVIETADSGELPRYGIKFGLTNFAAAYATGLLLARRLLKGMKLDDKFSGVEKADGEVFNQEPSEERRPLKCALDIGITPATRGSRIFGAMKGAVDGGLFVPHGVQRFPGYDPETKELDVQVLRDRIFGKHVADYMTALRDADATRYQTQFSRLIKAGVKPEGLGDMYARAHADIRKDPTRKVAAPRPEVTRKRTGQVIVTPKATYKRNRKLTCAERKARVAAKIQIIAQQAQQAQ